MSVPSLGALAPKNREVAVNECLDTLTVSSRQIRDVPAALAAWQTEMIYLCWGWRRVA